MKISTQNISLNFELLSEIDAVKDALIFLHGFTGSANDWKKTAALVVGLTDVAPPTGEIFKFP